MGDGQHMATVLVTGDDFAMASRLRGVVESLGHHMLHAVTTENIVEDIELNSVAVVYAMQKTQPFTEWEVSEMLAGDPAAPFGLSLVLLHSGDFDHRRYADSFFHDEMNSNLDAQLLAEAVVRHLGDRAGAETTDPLAGSGMETPKAPRAKKPRKKASKLRRH